MTAYMRGRPYAQNRVVRGVTPRPAADRALGREGLEKALGDALAGHLDQAQLGDVEDLGPGLVPGQGVAQGRGHLVPVLPDLHVDEVDDDDAADVPQPELAGHLLGRLEVVAEDGLLEVGLADVLAGVDVDDRQGLGALDDERTPRGQPDLAVERLVELLVDVVALEDRAAPRPTGS